MKKIYKCRLEYQDGNIKYHRNKNGSKIFTRLSFLKRSFPCFMLAEPKIIVEEYELVKIKEYELGDD